MRPEVEDVRALVSKLAVAYAHRMTDVERVDLVAVWRDAMDGVPWPEIEQAADAFIREPGRYMPKPGEVRSRALELARRRFLPATAGRDQIIWHSERWTEGVDVDGRPGLCTKCGNEVWFTRPAEGGGWHGHVTHRASCGQARRKEAA